MLSFEGIIEIIERNGFCDYAVNNSLDELILINFIHDNNLKTEKIEQQGDYRVYLISNIVPNPKHIGLNTGNFNDTANQILSDAEHIYKKINKMAKEISLQKNYKKIASDFTQYMKTHKSNIHLDLTELDFEEEHIKYLEELLNDPKS